MRGVFNARRGKIQSIYPIMYISDGELVKTRLVDSDRVSDCYWVHPWRFWIHY